MTSMLLGPGETKVFRKGRAPSWFGSSTVGNKRANGGTHGWTRDLFVILTLEEEVSVFEAKLRSVIICGMDMLVLCGRVRSYCNFSLTMLREESVGTEGKRALIPPIPPSTNYKLPAHPKYPKQQYTQNSPTPQFQWCHLWQV